MEVEIKEKKPEEDVVEEVEEEVVEDPTQLTDAVERLFWG